MYLAGQKATSLLLVEERGQVIIAAKAAHDAVDFGTNDDPDSSIEWPASFKWRIVALLAFAASTVTFNCVSIFPVANTIIRDLSGSNATRTDTILVVTIWELGEAAGPLITAPLSETFGRYPVYITCNLIFVSAIVVSSLAQNTTTFIAARAVAGMAVPSNVLNPAIIGDMFPSEQRGSAMSIVMLATLVGGNFGPLLGGIMSQILGWRAVLWIGAALAGICELLFLACFTETYTRPVHGRQQSGPGKEEVDHVECGVDFETSSSCLLDAVWRPARLMYDSGVLICLSLFGSVVFALFYVISVTLPGILEGVYGLSEAETGSAFLANGIGSFIGIMCSKVFLDKIYVRLREANNGIGLPEHRLPAVIVGAVTLPLAVALYGWSAANQLPLAILLLAVALMRLFPMLAFVPLMTYVVDAFGLYSASAMSGVIVVRCVACVLLPLATMHMSEALGHGWGCTILGAVCMILALIPVAVLRYGQHWRQRCRYTRLPQDA